MGRPRTLCKFCGKVKAVPYSRGNGKLSYRCLPCHSNYVKNKRNNWRQNGRKLDSMPKCSKCNLDQTIDTTGNLVCVPCRNERVIDNLHFKGSIPRVLKGIEYSCIKCKSTRHGGDGICKTCNQIYKNEWRKQPDGRLQHLAKEHRRRVRKFNNGGSFTKEEWLAVVKEQESICKHCKKTKELTVDHIVPISLGGSNNIDNIQGLCRSCNSRKGNRSTG